MHGNAEFLAPDTLIVPTSGLPPRITNLSIEKSGAPCTQCKSGRSIVLSGKSYTGKVVY